MYKTNGVQNKPLLLQIQRFNRNMIASCLASQPGVCVGGKVEEREGQDVERSSHEDMSSLH